MNHSYRLVWNDATQRYVPAPETARGSGTGRPGKSRAAKALAPAVALLGALLGLPVCAQAPPATALPTGGQVVSGQARIGQSGAQMTIDQASQKAIVHWQGFDIGSGAKVQFNQPNASAVALNRVVAGNASQIHGKLDANGQVWLVNPNGVVFGQGSRVNVGGLVASTLDTTNADFNAGKAVFTRGAAQGGITNQGDITVGEGGTLALLAPTVKNEGTLTARLGNVVLAGGDRVTLQAGAGGRLQVAVDPATVRTLIENQQLIVADGGQVVMTASAADALSASVVSNSGTVQARTVEAKDGRILLLADMRHGEVVHSGLLDASAPNGGDGGFVETSAAQVTLQTGRKVTTLAASGHTGTWLIDPNDYTIAATGGNITGADLSSDLNLNDVTIATVSQGTAGGNGDIHVNDAVLWSKNTLTLNAERNINVNAIMTASGTAALEMNYGGYSVGNTAAAAGSGVNMKLTDQGFAGRVDFTGANQLKINGDNYTILTQLGSADSITGQDLQGISGNLSGKYALGGDIDASATQAWSDGQGFAPIGKLGSPFTGALDGLGHHITGLVVNRPQEDSVGLVGRASGAILRNVGLEGGSVLGKGSVGGLVGNNVSTGQAALVSNAYATGDVSGTGSVGGLVGANFSSSSGVASIVGSHASGAVKATGDNAGGLVGFNSSTSANATISDSYATGAVSGSSFVGGLVGGNMSAFAGTASISGSRASGVVVGANDVGGLVGNSQALFGGTASIFDGHATGGNVVGEGNNVGGLVGNNLVLNGGSASISNSHATAEVSGGPNIGGNYVGGLVGNNSADDSGTALISKSYATGRAHGSSDYIGGLVGRNRAVGEGKAQISDAYATGVAEGNEFVGGLVGMNYGIASIFRSYATGNALGSDYIGGLVGGSNGTIEDSFRATTDAAGNAINTGSSRFGESKTFAELAQLSTFAGWDIDDQGGTGRIWRIYDGSTTPLLRSFLRQVTVAFNGSEGKAYDGQVASNSDAVYSTSLSGAQLGGQLSYASSGKNAGRYSVADGTLSVTGLFSGQNGYDIAYAGNMSLTIAQAKLGIAGTQVDGKIYDGNAAAQVRAGQLQGFVGEESVSVINASGVFDSKNAGTHGVSIGYTLADGGGGGLAANYVVSDSTSYRASIASKALTIEGSAVAGKTYDGTTVAQVTAGQLQGLVGNESLVVGASGVFDSKNAGTHGVAVTHTLANGSGGDLAANYVLSDATVYQATIARKPLAIESIQADKTYDGTTAAVVRDIKLTGLVGNEALTASASGSFDNPNAGLRSVSLVTPQLKDGPLGELSSNYDFKLGQESYQATISQKALSIAGTQVDGKIYDGNTLAQVRAGQLQGLVGNESLVVGASGVFASKNAGTHKVDVTHTLANGSGGGLAANYVVSDSQAYQASIAGKALTIEDSAVADKIYDGTAVAQVTVGRLQGLVGSESLVVGASGVFASKNAGTHGVAVGHTLADGSGLAANYVLSDTHAYQATIARKALDIAGTEVAGKIYDGTTAAQVTAGRLQGLVGNEYLVVGASGVFDSKNAGTHGVAVGYNLADGSGLASNYAAPADTRHMAMIDRAALTIAANNVVKPGGQFQVFDGTEFSTDAGLMPGETVRHVALASAGSAANASAGRYAIEAGNAQGSGGFEPGNYAIRYVDGRMDVTPASSGDIAAAVLCSMQSSERGTPSCAVQQRAAPGRDVPSRLPVLTMTADFIRLP